MSKNVTKILSNISFNINRKFSSNTNRECIEVQIPVPWGYLRGKWWGTTKERPLLGLHGWQDNCGSFNTLAPLLPKDRGFLAIDWPGHGLSSHYPSGFFYRSYDGAVALKFLLEYMGWSHLALIGHSLGSVQSFLFSALYPQNVDFVIGIDLLKPITQIDLVKVYARRIDSFMKYNKMIVEKRDPPAYTYEEAGHLWCKGVNNSVTPEFIHHLLERGVMPSPTKPGKYIYCRDPRLKSGLVPSFLQEEVDECARNVTKPLLNIKAINAPFFEDKKFYFKTADILEKTSVDFQRYDVPGTHHLHLINPESIIKYVNDFITKHDKSDRSQKENIIEKIFVHKY